nr:MAG TPA: hypothetical protein [Caudoviricetes sp.]
MWLTAVSLSKIFDCRRGVLRSRDQGVANLTLRGSGTTRKM